MSKYNLDLDYVIPMIDISQEELNEIIAEADAILQENKEAPEKLAVAYLKKAQCLQKLEELKQNEGHNYLYYKLDKEYKKNQNRIKKLIEKALEIIPNMPEALMQMGKYFVKMSTSKNKKIDKAIEMYTAAIQLNPDYAAAYNNRGNTAHDVYSIYLDGIVEIPYSVGVSVAIKEITSNFCCGRSYTKLIKEYFSSETPHLKESDKFFIIWKKAISDYTEAIRKRPFYAPYYNNRGTTYLRLRDHEKAIEDFTCVIKYGTDDFKKNIKICNLLGQEYTKTKDYEKAINGLSELMRLVPDHHESLLYRGFVYLTADNKDNAIADMEEYYCRQNNDEPETSSSKCSICGLPSMFTKRLKRTDDGSWICGKCRKKNMPKSIKMDEIDTNSTGFITDTELENAVADIGLEDIGDFIKEMLLESFAKPKPEWLTKLTIDELRTKAKEFVKPKPPEAILINNIPIHKNQSSTLLEGETFKTHSNKNVEVSNLGRVKSGDHILEQYDLKNNGYLFVDINNESIKVYRLVAETWLERPDHSELPEEKEFCYNTVHHISNNGYDNRTENLMWVTEWQHAMIHPWISIDDFNHEELCLLLESYAGIDIAPDDYQRMLDIAQRAYQIGNPPGEGKEYRTHWENIIKPLEDLVMRTGENTNVKK
jgi:tetratricopeptide (TPR) repeat protein